MHWHVAFDPTSHSSTVSLHLHLIIPCPHRKMPRITCPASPVPHHLPHITCHITPHRTTPFRPSTTSRDASNRSPSSLTPWLPPCPPSYPLAFADRGDLGRFFSAFFDWLPVLPMSPQSITVENQVTWRWAAVLQSCQ